jgi:tRNA (adenine37-N6)-methyltransferase
MIGWRIGQLNIICRIARERLPNSRVAIHMLDETERFSLTPVLTNTNVYAGILWSINFIFGGIMRIGRLLVFTVLAVLLCVVGCANLSKNRKDHTVTQTFTLHPIGSVKKEDGHTYIVIEKKYQPGLMRLEDFSHVTVIYWFHLNDTPEKRSVLQVHPQGNEDNPMRGVFATHSPARPNLIAISRCKILSVKDNVIEIDSIDAFPDTPVLDLKN